MTVILPIEVACPACGRVFTAFDHRSTFLTGDPRRDREEREMIADLTRNGCPGCGRTVAQDEIPAAAQ